MQMHRCAELPELHFLGFSGFLRGVHTWHSWAALSDAPPRCDFGFFYGVATAMFSPSCAPVMADPCSSCAAAWWPSCAGVTAASWVPWPVMATGAEVATVV